MGKALGERERLMDSGPPKAVEAIVAILVPPACREELLGDLHERYRSPLQYGFEAVLTIPLVILSRIRRTADHQVLLIQAFALYASFLVAAWLKGEALLRDEWELMRLATPAGMALLGLMLEDAYAKPGWRTRFQLARGPLLGIGLALASQGIFWISSPRLAVPPWILFYGCAAGLLLSSAVRILIPPAAEQLQQVSPSALWIKPAGGSLGIPPGIVELLRVAAIVAVMVMASTWLASYAGIPAPRIFAFLSIPWIGYEVWKRA
jgi:hypothetical protein